MLQLYPCYVTLYPKPHKRDTSSRSSLTAQILQICAGPKPLLLEHGISDILIRLHAENRSAGRGALAGRFAIDIEGFPEPIMCCLIDGQIGRGGGAIGRVDPNSGAPQLLQVGLAGDSGHVAVGAHPGEDLVGELEAFVVDVDGGVGDGGQGDDEGGREDGFEIEGKEGFWTSIRGCHCGQGEILSVWDEPMRPWSCKIFRM